MRKTIVNRFFLYFMASVVIFSTVPISVAHAADVSIKGWKLNLPSDKDGSNGFGKGCSQEISQPKLDEFASAGGSEWFKKTTEGLDFYVDSAISACTTGGSSNPRSELREMTADGGNEADWGSDSGTHRMLIRQKIAELKGGEEAVVIGQIHDAGDDVTVFRLEKNQLYITNGDHKAGSPIATVSVGQEITVGFDVSGGVVKYFFSPTGEAAPPTITGRDLKKSFKGGYFKAGNYYQGGKDGGKSRIIVTGLGVTHDGSMPSIGEGGGGTSSSTSCGPDDYDSPFYNTNDILYYSPCGPVTTCSADSSASNSIIEGNDNEEKIYNFLTTTPISTNGNKPLNPVQAAAMMGNFYQESKFDPEMGSQGGSDPYGLVQWIPDRKTKLLKLSAPETLETQLKFVVTELQGLEKAIMSHADFKDASDVDKATLAVRKTYERPGEAEARDDIRISKANEILDKFSGTTPSSLNTAINTGTGSEARCVGGGNSKFVTDDGFVVYNQEDSAWANNPYGSTTVKAAGCGPSAMAAIITALTGKQVTPAETTKYADEKNLYVEGAGSSHSLPAVLAPNWGLTAKKIAKNTNDINTALRGGGLVIVAGTGAAPFTAAGHYIVIRGVTDSGKWKIADSNGSIGQKNSTQEWDPDPILINAAGSSIYVVTK